MNLPDSVNPVSDPTTRLRPQPPIRALVIERDARVRALADQVLTLAGHVVRGVGEVAEGVAALAEESFDVVLLNGAQLATEAMAPIVAASARDSFAIVATTTADDGDGVRLLRQGVHGVLASPIDPDALRHAIERAGQDARRMRELLLLRGLLGGQADSVLVGRSPAMQRLRELVHRAAASAATVVVSGEPGTGKALVARTIHALSAQAAERCTVVSCTARDGGALERELFGGAGSSDGDGATVGALARIGGGTLIIDDATSLSAALQTRLLRALQERAFSGRATQRLVITVRESRAAGLGAPPPRYDLLGRAGVFTIAVPPLRDRRSDIPLLAAHFRARFVRESGCEAPPIGSDVVGAMLGYDWPGNVRQLEQYVARLMLAPPGARVPFESPSPSLSTRATVPSLLEGARAAHWTLDVLERAYIERVLDEEGGHQSRAAERLGIDRRTLYRKLKQYRAADAAQSRDAAPSARGAVKSA